jgi:autotransporter-associated beta strand protein
MGSNTYSGTTTISAGTLQLGPGGTLGPATVADNSVLQINRPDAFTLANSIGGTGALVQTGAGTTTLSGTNSYSGGTRVNAGNVVFSATSAIPAGGTVLIGSSGAVNVTGAYSNVSGWLGSGKISPTSSGALALTAASNENINMAGYPKLSLGAASPVTTYSGVLTPAGSTYYLGGGGGTLTFTPSLTGSSSLVVNGPGTVLLTGSDTYTGGTTVTNGTLKVTSPASIPTGGNLNVGGNLDAFLLSASPADFTGASTAAGGGLDSLPASDGAIGGTDPLALPVAGGAPNPTSAAATVNAVPEPNALLLILAAGGCSLVYRSVRRH